MYEILYRLIILNYEYLTNSPCAVVRGRTRAAWCTRITAVISTALEYVLINNNNNYCCTLSRRTYANRYKIEHSAFITIYVFYLVFYAILNVIFCRREHYNI